MRWRRRREGEQDLTGRSDPTDRSDQGKGGPKTALRPHGGYRRLRSFQVIEIIYDGTVAFCDRFIGKRSRTHDQMVQAARSGGCYGYPECRQTCRFDSSP